MLAVRYYDTYHFCDIVRGVLDEPVHVLRALDGFYGDDLWSNLVEPFRKYSAFHLFLEHVIDEVVSDKSFSVDPRKMKLPIEYSLKYNEIQHQSFAEYLVENNSNLSDVSEIDIYDYIDKLRVGGQYEELIDHCVDEVFYVLFNNRKLLLQFNQLISSNIELSSPDSIPVEVSHLFRNTGTLKRVAVPKWVQDAVFFRDKGRCVFCDMDLSGTLNRSNKKNYDHIVPFARFGLNDISNIQLLCVECNTNVKKANPASTSVRYHTWYDAKKT